MPTSGPFLPTTAGLGGQPNKSLDDPITAVYLVLFLIGAITHMAILQLNQRKSPKHKFLMSGMIFGFCMARVVSCTMRIVWSTTPTNISVAIAAQIFVAAGVVVLFVVNLIFAQRIVRACHPKWAWSKSFSMAFKVYDASIIVMLIALITCTIQSFFTLSTNTRRIDRDVQRVGGVYFAVAAFIPIPLVLLRIVVPKSTRIEKFGEGHFRTKIFVLLFSSAILTLGAAFRAGISFMPRPITDPAWYHSKACFYIFDFGVEIVVVYLYAFLRVDKRFHVPDGSHHPGDYAGEKQERRTSMVDRVMSEEQVFDDQETEVEESGSGSVAPVSHKHSRDIEAGVVAPASH
jgi:hypothetical protein